MRKSKLLQCVTIISLLFSAGCIATGGVTTERVETYPDGIQEHPLAGFIGTSEPRFERVFNVSYSKAWDATLKVATDLAKRRESPGPFPEKEKGIILIGRITSASFIGASPGAWTDEIRIKLSETAENTTSAKVWRRIISVGGITGNQIETPSNGELEKWILTQIEDELKK